MSHPVKKITIEGFRGILSPFELDFVGNSSPRSMIVHGDNGTGKSSITDAWEWFQTENISHLRREGAQQAAFCHMSSTQGCCYVELSLSDSALGTVRLEYDHSRVTLPTSTGNISGVRKLCPYPCHIRFGDLTRFVYLTKSDRFDELAKLMGFVPQVEYLKALQRTARRLSDNIAEKYKNLSTKTETLKTKSRLEQLDEKHVWTFLSNKLADVKIKCEGEKGSVDIGMEELRNQVTKDKTAQELSDLKNVATVLSDLEIGQKLTSNLDDYSAKVEVLIRKQETLTKLVLADLYQAAESILTTAKDRTVCPLCGQRFDGDLCEHIRQQHKSLEELIKSQEALDAVRDSFGTESTGLGSLECRIRDIGAALQNAGFKDRFGPLISFAKAMDGAVKQSLEAMAVSIKSAKPELMKELRHCSVFLNGAREKFESLRGTVEKDVTERMKNLEKDSAREKLVDTLGLLTAVRETWEDIQNSKYSIEKLKLMCKELDSIVGDYVVDSTKDVEARFQLISNNVDKYFSILEQRTLGIRSPRLRLLKDQDRAALLEIEFQGETIAPAYKYLSESQLNSFGLAVFLASVRQFNSDFCFIILDDIINSFDAYKRPQVIKLLNSEFSDFQVLVMTHDELWKDRLFRTMPSWVRVELYDYAPSRGPLVRGGKTSIERIQQLLDEARPQEAGRNLGPYLEQQLQLICENFEVMVKYNLRNEYTLDPLFSFLIARLKKKLGPDHEVLSLVNTLWQNSGFRNFCSHWRETSSQYTKEELQEILDQWIIIENHFYCQSASCSQILQYDGTRTFQCPCGSSRLEKNE